MPLLAPQASTITLSTASTVVQANGTTEIRATVLEASGTPVQNGTTVTFTTNLGAVAGRRAHAEWRGDSCDSSPTANRDRVNQGHFWWSGFGSVDTDGGGRRREWRHAQR